MSDTLNLWLPCLPPTVTGQMKRAQRTNKGIRFYKSKDQEKAEATLEGLLAGKAPTMPIVGPTHISVTVVWPYLKSHTEKKATRCREDLIWHCQKPDADNFAKGVIDALVRMRFLEDDKQVCSLQVEKFYGPADRVGIEISIERNYAVERRRVA